MSKELASLSSKIDPQNSITYVPRWPLVVFLLCSFTCLTLSAIFHNFYVMNKRIFGILIRLDYGGICIMIMGGGYPLNYYVFACDEVFFARCFFLTLLTFSCIVTFIYMMVDNFDPRYLWLRNLMFVILGLSLAFPFIYLAFVTDDRYYSKHNAVPFLVGGASYILGSFINVKRFPERYFPKTFDNSINSHSIFHILIVLGCAIHFNASF